MRCPECGRSRWVKMENRLERIRGLEASTCSCHVQNEGLLRLLTLLATFGIDPAAPPVLGNRLAGQAPFIDLRYTSS